MRILKEVLRQLYRRGWLWGEIAKELGLKVEDIKELAKEIHKEECENEE